MVLDPIPQPLSVHFFASRPQPPTSLYGRQCRDSLPYSSRLIHVCAINHLIYGMFMLIHDSWICDPIAFRRIDTSAATNMAGAVTHYHVRHDSFMCVP